MSGATGLDAAALITELVRGGVRFVVNGSVAALAAGVELSPGDLDVAPALDPDNLERLAEVLRGLGARPKHVPGWEGSLTPEQCAAWTPEPADERHFDHRYVTPHGELDVCPRQAGTFVELTPRAIRVDAFGHGFGIAHPADVIAYWRRWNRPRDRDRIERLEAAAAGLDPAAARAPFAARLERAFPPRG